MPPSSTLALGADFFLGHKARPARRILGAQKEKGAVQRKHTSATVPPGTGQNAERERATWDGTAESRQICQICQFCCEQKSRRGWLRRFHLRSAHRDAKLVRDIVGWQIEPGYEGKDSICIAEQGLFVDCAEVRHWIDDAGGGYAEHVDNRNHSSRTGGGDRNLHGDRISHYVWLA